MTHWQQLVDRTRALMAAHGMPMTTREVAEGLGMDTRRLARLLQRRAISTDALQEALQCWSARYPALSVDLTRDRIDVSFHRERLDGVHVATAFLDRAESTALGAGLVARNQLVDGLAQLLVTVGARRVMMLRASATGRALQRRFTGHVVAEVVRPPTPLVSEVWRDAPLTEAYQRILTRVVGSGAVALRTKTLTDPALREIYTAHGIVSSDVACVLHDEHAIWYVSAVYTDDVDPKRTDRVAAQAAVLVDQAHTLENLVLPSERADIS